MLSRRFPHLLSEVDIALRSPHPLRLLLVGDPGAGKTSFGRALAGALGLHSMLYSAAGVADGAFGGTSAQWASSRMSVPLQLIVRSHAANPIMIVDELDKVDLDRRNGSLADSLLGFLEPSSAQRLMDLALEVEVDLSHVGYIATANDLDSVPAMLRDRFKIVRVPLPELVHLPALTEHLLTDLAAERGVNRAWLLPLDGDEIELVGRHWKSRSLRQLRRFIEQIVEGRERLAVRS
jgi:ATP-dependent Lon protease